MRNFLAAAILAPSLCLSAIRGTTNDLDHVDGSTSMWSFADPFAFASLSNVVTRLAAVESTNSVCGPRLAAVEALTNLVNSAMQPGSQIPYTDISGAPWASTNSLISHIGDAAVHFEAGEKLSVTASVAEALSKARTAIQPEGTNDWTTTGHLDWLLSGTPLDYTIITNSPWLPSSSTNNWEIGGHAGLATWSGVSNIVGESVSAIPLNTAVYNPTNAAEWIDGARRLCRSTPTTGYWRLDVPFEIVNGGTVYYPVTNYAVAGMPYPLTNGVWGDIRFEEGCYLRLNLASGDRHTESYVDSPITNTTIPLTVVNAIGFPNSGFATLYYVVPLGTNYVGTLAMLSDIPEVSLDATRLTNPTKTHWVDASNGVWDVASIVDTGRVSIAWHGAADVSGSHPDDIVIPYPTTEIDTNGFSFAGDGGWLIVSTLDDSGGFWNFAAPTTTGLLVAAEGAVGYGVATYYTYAVTSHVDTMAMQSGVPSLAQFYGTADVLRASSGVSASTVSGIVSTATATLLTTNGPINMASITGAQIVATGTGFVGNGSGITNLSNVVDPVAMTNTILGFQTFVGTLYGVNQASTIPGYLDMSNKPPAGALVTLSTNAPALNSYPFGFVYSAGRVTSLVTGNATLRFHAWYNSGGSRSASIHPELCLINTNGTIAAEYLQASTVVLQGSDVAEIPVSIPIPSNITANADQRLCLRFKVTALNNSPTIYLTLDDAEQLTLSVPISSGSYVTEPELAALSAASLKVAGGTAVGELRGPDAVASNGYVNLSQLQSAAAIYTTWQFWSGSNSTIVADAKSMRTIDQGNPPIGTNVVTVASNNQYIAYCSLPAGLTSLKAGLYDVRMTAWHSSGGGDAVSLSAELYVRQTNGALTEITAVAGTSAQVIGTAALEYIYSFNVASNFAMNATDSVVLQFKTSGRGGSPTLYITQGFLNAPIPSTQYVLASTYNALLLSIGTVKMTNGTVIADGVLNGTNGLFFVPSGSTNRYWALGGQ